MAMVKVEETHLTKRQYEVLKMRAQGKSLAEIAKELGTSRSNISRIAKISEQNIEKAKNTMKLVETVDWPVKINARAGANIYKVSERAFKRADEKGIDITHNYAEVVRLIAEMLGRKNIRRRKALRNFTVVISGEGNVEVI
jgi:hypothetical protein